MKVTLEYSLYPREAIAIGMAAFSEACEFIESEVGNDASQLEIVTRDGAPVEVPYEFLSYTLSAALEMRLRVSAQ